MTTMKVFVDDELIKEEEVFSAENWNEIPDRVKENILSKHGDICVDYEWWDCIYEDAKNVDIKIRGFDIDRGTIDGFLIYSSSGVKQLILENHGKNCETYKTVQRYDLRRKGFSESEFERELLENYLTMLRNEYEYLTSEEAVIEMFKANKYVFDKWGNIVS